MRGLRTAESRKFLSFFELVQKEAGDKNAVFFLSCGEGRDFEDGNMEGEDLTGWLIPKDQAEKFESKWQNHRHYSELSEWDDFFTWAEWSKANGQIKIEFTTY